MFDDIECSYPPIDEERMSAAERALFASLPDDYRAFLGAHNGGFVHEFRYTFRTGVPCKSETIDSPSGEDWVVEFLGIRTTTADGRWPSNLIQTVEDHRAEKFLPTDVIAIARCGQSSLVCISLRPREYGAIYYWDWYWQYPWCRPFFEERIERARAQFENPQTILDDPQHAEHAALADTLNFATLVKLSDNFSSWYRACYDSTKEDSQA